MKIITWMDLEGRYRCTFPAYDHLIRKKSVYIDDVLVDPFTEDDCINWVWTVLVQSGLYGIEFEHPMFLVDNDVLRAKVATIGGQRYRYQPSPDRKYEAGAWRMDDDGTPKLDEAEAERIRLGV